MTGLEQRRILNLEHEGTAALQDTLPVIDGGHAIRRGETAFIGGSSSVTNSLLHSVVFRSLAVSSGIVLWIDGGNSFDPYRISELAEKCGYDPAAILSRIRIARAFTAHQMEAIARSASNEAANSDVSALVVSSVAELFTGDVGWKEGIDLLESTVKSLKKLTVDCNIWTLMTSGVSASSSAEMERIIDENYTRVLHVDLDCGGLLVESDGFVITINRWNEKRHQRSLLEFVNGGD